MERIYSLIELGGPVVALLATISVLSLAVILFKALQYWRRRVGMRKHAENVVRLWHAGKHAEALACAGAARSLSASIVAEAIRLKAEGHDRGQIEERLSREATGRLHELQSGFRFLDMVAQTSPLLGLFGTILGMIEAFRDLQAAGSAVDPSTLAGGIWVALLTTAAGLAVAMPVSLFLSWLESRLENERVNIETLTSDILSEIPAGSRHLNMASDRLGELLTPGDPAGAH